jgi:arylsulfatase A-like enzyme
MRQNAILITLDCVRQDHLYDPQVATPAVDALLAEGVTFTNAFSQSNNTLSSHTSIFTGQYLAAHGVYNNFSYRALPPEGLIGQLRAHGWRTACFTGTGFLAAAFAEAFGNGDHLPERRSAAETTALALRWLEAEAARPFFLWLHYYDAHMPYQAPEHWRAYDDDPGDDEGQESLAATLRRRGLWYPPELERHFEGVGGPAHFPALYKAAISAIDEQVGLVTAALKALGWYDSTILIVTSDHGENLLDNGIYCDHKKLYDATTKVPLVITNAAGAAAGATVDRLVQHVDLMPTLLAAFSLPSSPLPGEDLHPLMAGAGESRARFAVCEHVDGFQRSIRTEAWQYIATVPGQPNKWGFASIPFSLLRRDSVPTSEERPNEWAERPEVARGLGSLLEQALSGHDALRPLKRQEEQVVRRLQQLGYIE